MKFFKVLRALRDINTAATQTSREVLERAETSAPDIDQFHEHALMRLAEATEQARTLSSMDRRNHYSQSLTESFQGRTA